MSDEPTSPAAGSLSRRRFLGGVGAMGVAAAAVGPLAACASTGPVQTSAGGDTVAFHGDHQAGILDPSPVQSHLVYAAFDVIGEDRQALQSLLQQWTAVAAAMSQGLVAPGGTGRTDAPPQDTGEAVGLSAARLTITCGVGTSLFDGRFGLAARRPPALTALPALPADALDPAGGGGDIGIQACADDPQVAFHAVRELGRIGAGVVNMRWLRNGFLSAAQGETPRNLLGFKDGTSNLTAADGALLQQYLWAGGEGDPSWMAGGCYQVVRRMQLDLAAWDQTGLSTQQDVFGRAKQSGAPLSGGVETTAPDFSVRRDGSLEIPPTAHIRLMSHELNGGLRILRRGYSFADTVDPSAGEVEAGFLFIACVRRPSQFITLARHLAADSLAPFVTTTASGLFAIPGGLAPGGYWGDALFA